MTGNTIIKNVKQYSSDLSGENYNCLLIIAERYNNAKNYFYQRYSGVGSLALLKHSRKEIRDELVKQPQVTKKWGLQARFWKNALDESVSNIKTQWSNTKREVKAYVYRNDISDENRHFIFYILKSDSVLQDILLYKKPTLPEKFDNVQNKKELFKLIRRLVRKYKGSISKAKNKTFLIDQEMYSYKNGNIEIMPAERGKRIIVPVNTNFIFNGSLKLCLKRDRLTINKASKIKIKKSYDKEQIVGIDKNYVNVIASSNENVYGDGLNDVLMKKSDVLKEKGKERQKFWGEKRRSEDELLKGGISQKRIERLNKKIANLKKYNLGYKKYDRNKNKYDQYAKALINSSLNKFLKDETPSEVVTEKLNFNGKKKYTKRGNRLMSSWVKGYLRERIEYKTSLNKIKITEVNAAYTSQVCGECGAFGRSIGDTFHCPNCGRVVLVHINAAQGILKRRDDEEIHLFTSPKKTKQILLRRMHTVVGSSSNASPAKDDWHNQDFIDKNTPIKSELLKKMGKT